MARSDTHDDEPTGWIGCLAMLLMARLLLCAVFLAAAVPLLLLALLVGLSGGRNGGGALTCVVVVLAVGPYLPVVYALLRSKWDQAIKMSVWSVALLAAWFVGDHLFQAYLSTYASVGIAPPKEHHQTVAFVGICPLDSLEAFRGRTVACHVFEPFDITQKLDKKKPWGLWHRVEDGTCSPSRGDVRPTQTSCWHVERTENITDAVVLTSFQSSDDQPDRIESITGDDTIGSPIGVKSSTYVVSELLDGSETRLGRSITIMTNGKAPWVGMIVFGDPIFLSANTTGPYRLGPDLSVVQFAKWTSEQ